MVAGTDFILDHFPFVRSGRFLNGAHKFSELVLDRMALLLAVLLFRSAKAREFGELWREKCARAPSTFPVKLAINQFFSAGQTGPMENNLTEVPCK